MRNFWLLVMLGWSAELTGDLILAVYDIVLNHPTFPSVADLFFLSFYPLLLLALIRVPSAAATRSQRLRIALDCATIVVGGGAAVWYFLLGPILTEGGGLTSLEAAVSIAYPVGDVLLLGALALVMVRGGPEALRLPLRWIVAGLLMLITADTIYGASQLHGTYSPGDPVDTLYLLTAAPFVLAAARQRRMRRGDPHGQLPARAESSLRASRLPLLAMIVGFGVLLGTQWQDQFFPDLSLLIFALVLAGLVAARQYFAQVELIQLQGRVQTIVDNVAEGIVSFNEGGTIIWVNPAAEMYFGAAPGSLEGKRVDALFDAIAWSQMAPMVGVDGVPGPVIGERLKFTGRRGDGSIFPAEIVVTEARLDGGRILISIGS